MNANPDTIEWTAAGGGALEARTADWWYRIITMTDGTAQLAVRRDGVRFSARTYKQADYASTTHAKRAAALYERTYTHHDGHLHYRDPARPLRPRGWHWHPGYNAGHPDHLDN